MAELRIPEGMVRFTHALVEDTALRTWFLSFEQVPASLRHNAFVRMAEQMRADRQDPDLAAAVFAMTHAELFEAVRQALRERCGV